MAMEDVIRQKLEAALAPRDLKIINESHLHAGHASSPESGESHFRVLIVADAFMGQSRIARHRAINTVLADELKGGIHALAIKAMTPEEAERS